MKHTIKHHIKNKRTSKLPYPGYMDTDTSINMSGAGLGNWWRHKKMMWKFEKLMNKMRKGERKIEKYLLALDDFHTKYKLYDSKITAGNAELYNAMRINYIYKLQLKDIEDSKDSEGKKPLKSMISSNINKIETKMAIIKRELVVNFERNDSKDFNEFLKLGKSLAPKLKKFNDYLKEILGFNEKYKKEMNYAEIADKTSVSVELGDFEDLKGEKSKSTQKIQSRVTKYRKDFDKIQNLNSDYFDKIFKGKSKAESLKSKIEQLKNHIDGMSLSKLKDNDNIYKEWKDMGEKFYEALSQFVSQKFVKSAETIKLNIGNIKRIYRETANPTIQTMVVPEFEKAEQNAKSAMEIYKTLTKEMGRIRNNFINFAKADELENDLSTLTESMMAATSRISSIVDFLKQYSTDGGSWKTYFSNISGGGIHMVGGANYIDFDDFRKSLYDFGFYGKTPDKTHDGKPSFYSRYRKLIPDRIESFTQASTQNQALIAAQNGLVGTAQTEVNTKQTALTTAQTKLKPDPTNAILLAVHAKAKTEFDTAQANLVIANTVLSTLRSNEKTELDNIETKYLGDRHQIIEDIYVYLKDKLYLDYDSYFNKKYTGYYERTTLNNYVYNPAGSKTKGDPINLDKNIPNYDKTKSYLIPILGDYSGNTGYHILVPAVVQLDTEETTNMNNLYIVYVSNTTSNNRLDFINPKTGFVIIYNKVMGNDKKINVDEVAGSCPNNNVIYISQMLNKTLFETSKKYDIDNKDKHTWNVFFDEKNNGYEADQSDPNVIKNSIGDCSGSYNLINYFYSTNNKPVTLRHQFISDILSDTGSVHSKTQNYKNARDVLNKPIASANTQPSESIIKLGKAIPYNPTNTGTTGTSGGLGLGATGTTTTTYNASNPEGERLTAQLTREVFGEIQKYEEDTQKEIAKFLKGTKISSTSKDQTPEALLNDISSYIKKLMLIEHEFKEFKEAKTVDQTMIGWDLQETMTNKNIDTDRSGIMELKSKLDTQYKDVLETDLNVYKDSNPLLYMRKVLQKQDPGISALQDSGYFAKFLNEKSNLTKLTTGLINPKEAYDVECGIAKVYEAFVKREKDTSNPNPITFGNDATYQYSMIQKAEECKKKKQNDKTKKENEKDRKAGYKATRVGDEAEDGDGNTGKSLGKKSKGGSRRTLKLSSKRRKTIKKRKPKRHIIKNHQKH
jgi:hypothetical protein